MSSNNVNNIFSQNYYTQEILNIMKSGGATTSYKPDSALNNKIEKDTLEINGCTDGKNDGKITFGEKVKNFAKGIVSPITTMFKSPKNFLIGAGMIAGTAALIVATGGAAAPFLVAAGVIGGGIQIGVNAHKASKATTDIQAKEAWQGMGTGTTAVVGSAIGAKSALKATGTDTSKMGIIKSTIECIKQAPSSIRQSFNAFKTGAFVQNFKTAFHIKDKSAKPSPDEAKPRSDAPDATVADAPDNQPNVSSETTTATGSDVPDATVADAPDNQASVSSETTATRSDAPDATVADAPDNQPNVSSETTTATGSDAPDATVADAPDNQLSVSNETTTATSREVQTSQQGDIPEVAKDAPDGTQPPPTDTESVSSSQQTVEKGEQPTQSEAIDRIKAELADEISPENQRLIEQADKLNELNRQGAEIVDNIPEPRELAQQQLEKNAQAQLRLEEQQRQSFEPQQQPEQKGFIQKLFGWLKK